jgi:cytochrome P450
VALKRRLSQAVTQAVKGRRIRRTLSVLHPQFSTDPYPLYHQLREMNPVRRDPLLGWWVVTGFPEVTAVLRDKRFSSQPRSQRTASGTMELDVLPAGPVRRQLAAIAMVLTRQVVFMDPPVHMRVRMRLSEMFSPAGMNKLRERVQEVADDLIDRVAPKGEMDLIDDFAYPLPLTIVAEMMGMAGEDFSLLKRWSNLFGRMLSFDTPLKQDLESRRDVIEARAYFDRMIARGNGTPLSRLLTGPNAVDADELFANCGFLLAAGHETSTSLLGNGLRVLLDHPDQFAKLRDDPGVMTNAVEELLRFESPVQWSGRRATEDVELAGQRIKKNEFVFISLGAANRDPRQFPEPDKLDLTRANASKHLAFSGGNHYCLGAALGRIELQIGFATLLRRLKNFKIEATPSELRWRTGTAIRTLESLPVRFELNNDSRLAQPAPGTEPARVGPGRDEVV